MKLVIGASYWGLDVDKTWAEATGRNPESIKKADWRTDKQLIRAIETGEYPGSNLAVVEIPDEATDWRVEDYDGQEWVVFVMDGKMQNVYGEGHAW